MLILVVLQFKRVNRICSYKPTVNHQGLGALYCKKYHKDFVPFSRHIFLLCFQSISITFSCWCICCVGQSFPTAEIISHSHGCPACLSLSHESPLVFEESVKTRHLSFLSWSQVMAPDHLGSWLVFFSDSRYITGFPDLRHHLPSAAGQVLNTISKSLLAPSDSHLMFLNSL